MKFSISFKLFVLFFFCINVCSSQVITGLILDGNSNNPIDGASIYFDNTTIGTTSNEKGKFTLEYNKNIQTQLIVSFIGYKTLAFEEFSTDEEMTIYLYESNEVLDEVILTVKGAWSRELKLKEFLRHYLGESDNGKAGKILNKDDIILRYNDGKKQLTARAKSPILIKNTNLKYIVTVELDHFEVNYSFVSKNKKRLNLDYVFYSGANFFKSLQDVPTKRTLEKREEAYEGSVLHFMRALAQEKLNKEGYRIHLGNTPINPNRFIKVFPIENSNNVYVKLKDKLNILYKRVKQSSIENFTDEFYVDHFGNHSPPENVRFGGDLGKQRMGDALPLDFLLVKHKKSKSL
jgi:carboxypeptidase-like protein